MYFFPNGWTMNFHFFIRDISLFVDIITRAKADIGIHIFHDICFEFSHHLELFFLRTY